MVFLDENFIQGMSWRCQMFLSKESEVPDVFLHRVLTSQFFELSHFLHSLNLCIFVMRLVDYLVHHLKHIFFGVAMFNSLSYSQVLKTIDDTFLLFSEWQTKHFYSKVDRFECTISPTVR